MKVCPTCRRLLRADAGRCPDDGAAPELVESLPPETRLGSYRIVKMLGEGGMGFVYEAVHETLNRRTAIKMLRPELATNEQVVTRFLNEAKAANLIAHPNIVNIYDYGDGGDGNVYFVMEFLEGEMLDDLMRRRPMKLPLFLHTFRQVAKALAAAHAKQIVHRDLKPANVYVVPREDNPAFIKLLDFGIAQLRGAGAVQGLTVAGSVMGTPQYMSPEQISGGAIDARTDVWALGAMMYRALTWQAPFKGEEFAELAAKILYQMPQPVGELVSLPPSLSQLIGKCMERSLADRCQSIAEVLAGLDRAQNECKLSDEAVIVGAAQEIEEGLAAQPGGPQASGPMTRGSLAGSMQKYQIPAAYLQHVRVPAPPAASGAKLGKMLAAGAVVVALGGAAFWKLGRGGEATGEAGGETPVVAGAPVGSDGANGANGSNGSNGSAAGADSTPATPATPAPEASALEGELAAALATGDATAAKNLAGQILREQIESGTLQERGFAVEALGDVRNLTTAQLLFVALKGPPDVRIKAARALAELRLPDAAPHLRKALADSGDLLKVELAGAMFRAGDKDARAILLRALGEESTKIAAAAALADGKDAAGREVLAETLEILPAGKGQWLRAAGGLLALGDAKAKKLLQDELAQADPGRSVAAATLLANAGEAPAREVLARKLADPDFARRGQAAVALARLGDARAAAWIGEGLVSSDSEERRWALAVCGALPGEAKGHLAQIAKLVRDEAPKVGLTAKAVLLGMEGTP